MHIVLCRHVKTNGLQCSAAALTGSALCYFHTRLHQGHARYRQTPATRAFLDEAAPGQTIELPPLEDRQSIQLALSQVINALAACKLEPKRATALLYGLQLASSNAAKLFLTPHATDGVRTLQTAPEDSATPGLDLAQPGAIYDTDPPQETFDDEQDEDEEYEQEIEDRVNERLAEIQAARLEARTQKTKNSHNHPHPPGHSRNHHQTRSSSHQTDSSSHQTGWPILSSLIGKGGLSSYARPYSFPPPQPLRTLEKVSQSPPNSQHRQRFISLPSKEPPMPQAATRIAATLTAILLSASLALAQQTPTPEPESASAPKFDQSNWAKASAGASSKHKLIIATSADPTRRHACHVESFTPDQLVCKGSFGKTNTYRPQEIAALILPGDIDDLRIRFLLGFNSALWQ